MAGVKSWGVTSALADGGNKNGSGGSGYASYSSPLPTRFAPTLKKNIYKQKWMLQERQVANTTTKRERKNDLEI
jgi:hypothetical protein